MTSPQELNLYHFSNNNPLRYLDPDGLQSDDPVDAGVPCGRPAEEEGIQDAATSKGKRLCDQGSGSEFLDCVQKLTPDDPRYKQRAAFVDQIATFTKVAVLVGGTLVLATTGTGLFAGALRVVAGEIGRAHV